MKKSDMDALRSQIKILESDILVDIELGHVVAANYTKARLDAMYRQLSKAIKTNRRTATKEI